MTGYTVVLVDSSNAKNGKTVNGRKAIGEFNSTKGEIVLDIGSDNVVATALHEVTHYAKINAPTQYNALRDAVLEHTTKSGKMKYYLEKYSNTYRTNNVYEITEEMTADAAEALLTNEKFISELLSDKSFVNAVVGENKGFVRKFLDTLHDIISSIKDYLKGRTVNHQIARELSEDVKALEKIEKLWRDALTAAVNNHAEISNAKENTDTQSSGVKMSIGEKPETKVVVGAIKDNMDKISKEEVFDVEYDSAVETYKHKSDYVLSVFDEQKNIAYRNDFGLIELVKSGAKSTIAHGYGKTKLSAVKAIKAVIENGNIITYTPNYEKTSVDRYIIAARGKIDNADAIMGVIVKSYPATKKNSKFYLHEVTIIKEADLPSMTAPQLSVDTVNKSASNNNISQIPETVKENSNKFSLSEPVEEKDNLIAVHNIYTDKLAKSLKLGGFPMPSIAVTKADMGHENYGECSFVFDKSTIDPKVDKRNKVYGGDAWTPTYPTIEYKVSEEVIQRVKDTREHNLFGKDGKFMHCSGGAFLLPETLNVKLRSRLQRLRSADFLCGIYEFAELSVSVLAGVGGFLDGVGEVLGFISGFVNALVSLFEGGVVGTKVTLHAVENCLRIVQLYLPALGAAAVLTKGLGGIGKGRTERFDFLFLLVAISLFRT